MPLLGSLTQSLPLTRHYLPLSLSACVRKIPKQSSPSSSPHYGRLSAPPNTSWSRSEANRGDKISLTRNEAIFQPPGRGSKGAGHDTPSLSRVPTLRRAASPTTTTERAQHEIVRARLSSTVFGHAAAPLDASHKPRGGGSCGVGGMSSLGSQHLDTRSSRDTHALPKCLTGCSYFLATRAFRAIVTRTTYREGGQGESGRSLEPFATYSAAFFLSRCSLPLLYPIVTLPLWIVTRVYYSAWTTAFVSWHRVWRCSLWDCAEALKKILREDRLVIDWSIAWPWIGDSDCCCWPVFLLTVSDFSSGGRFLDAYKGMW